MTTPGADSLDRMLTQRKALDELLTKYRGRGDQVRVEMLVESLGELDERISEAARPSVEELLTSLRQREAELSEDIAMAQRSLEAVQEKIKFLGADRLNREDAMSPPDRTVTRIPGSATFTEPAAHGSWVVRSEITSVTERHEVRKRTDATPHGKSLRPDVITANWNVRDGVWELYCVKVSGPVLRKDGTDSKVRHELRWRPPRSLSLGGPIEELPAYAKAWLREAEQTLPVLLLRGKGGA